MKSKFRQISSKEHIHKTEFGLVVKRYEIIRTNFDEVHYKLKDSVENCRNKNLCMFENRCVYDINFINIIIRNQEVIIAVTLKYMKFNSQLYALS